VKLPQRLSCRACAWHLAALLCAVALLSGSSCRGRACNLGSNGCDPVSIGGTVSGLTGTLVLELNGTDPITITANGSFVFDRKLPPDNSYTVTVLTQPAGETCTVSNGSGVAGIGVSNVAVNCQSTATGLAIRHASGEVQAYRIDPSSGALAASEGLAAAAAQGPAPGVLHPNGRYAYAVLTHADAVAAYEISAIAGTRPLNGSPFAAGAAPSAVAIDPLGRYAYVANFDSGDVYAYAIDAASGALRPLPGGPASAGSGPSALVVDPGGTYLYVANSLSHNVSAYAIDPAGGSLRAVAGGPYAAGSRPVSIVVDGSGRYLYVANQDSRDIHCYAIDPGSGALTPLASGPIAVRAAGSGRISLSVVH
jgi:6-phosphogluconolactonase